MREGDDDQHLLDCKANKFSSIKLITNQLSQTNILILIPSSFDHPKGTYLVLVSSVLRYALNLSIDDSQLSHQQQYLASPLMQLCQQLRQLLQQLLLVSHLSLCERTLKKQQSKIIKIDNQPYPKRNTNRVLGNWSITLTAVFFVTCLLIHFRVLS